MCNGSRRKSAVWLMNGHIDVIFTRTLKLYGLTRQKLLLGVVKTKEEETKTSVLALCVKLGRKICSRISHDITS